MSDQIANLLRRMVRQGRLSEGDFTFGGATPQALGLQVADGFISPPDVLELLDETAIRNGLSPIAAAWLRHLKVFLAVDSTNTRMALAAQTASVEGSAWFAELQIAGRGRRGRRWITPFATNMAVTLGFTFTQPPGGLGGLSLAAGLAVARLLRSQGVANAAVKWPNDVYIGRAKVCGILIEIITRAKPSTDPDPPPKEWDCIIGIGLNLNLPQHFRTAIDHPVTDLKSAGVTAGRNRIAAALISRAVETVQQFKRTGFAPLRAAYDEAHICQGKSCQIIQGVQTQEGVVLGVTNEGALRMRCSEGLREFTGGAVSLRPAH